MKIDEKMTLASAIGRDKQKNNFNLIRMLAATGVLISHAWPISFGPGAKEPLSHSLGITLGTICVYIFFSISGFFIAKSFDGNNDRLRFIRARALRLFPALLVNLSLTILVSRVFLTSAPPQSFWAEVPGFFFQNLTLVKIDYYLPGVFLDAPYGPAINGSLWTLFYEVVCYAGLFTVGVAGLIRRPRLFLLLFIALLLFTPSITHFSARREIIILSKLLLPFSVGVLFYVIREYIIIHWSFLSVFAFATVMFRDTSAFLPLFVFTLAYTTFWLGFAFNSLLSSYNKAGDYSYGIYIYAFPIQQVAASKDMLTPLQNISFSIPITFIFAVFSWHLIERPSLSFIQTDDRSART